MTNRHQNMTSKLLDEQSFQAREQDILDAAIALIDKLGIESITMDKVVLVVPYSKGTVYKHFLGKEDLFLANGNRAMRVMLDLFARSARYEGGTRERMLLLNISYLLYAILHPVLFQSMQCAKSPSVYCKSSEQRLQEQELLESKVMETIAGIVDDAEESNHLSVPAHMTQQQVCFSTWTIGFGAISLLAGELDQCSGSEGLIVEREMLNQYNLLLDGYQWLPLSKDKDYESALQLALGKVFPRELDLLKEREREFNFS